MADLVSLVAAEWAFADSSPQLGTRGAFLTHLADDAILFRPRPVHGKEWLTAQPARPGWLTWYPMLAVISHAGDLGYTSGPWEFRPNGPADAPVAYGFFTSLWRIQANGEWKVELDCGISCPPPGAPIAPLRPEMVAGSLEYREAAPLDRASPSAELMTLDRAVAEAHYAGEARLHRDDEQPYVGTAAIQAALAARPPLRDCQTAEARLARSGDLGYTYGLAQLPPGGATSEVCYLRIWKMKDDAWRIVFEVESPVPPGA